MIYLNKIDTPNQKCRLALPVIIASIIFSLFFSSLASAQEPSKSIVVHYRINPEPTWHEQWLMESICNNIEEKLKEIPVSGEFHTETQLFPKNSDNEFNDLVKNEKKGTFALSIRPAPKGGPTRTVQFTLTDCRTSRSWVIDVNANDSENMKKRIQYAAGRIKSIIADKPYKILFSCFTYNGNKNDNLSTLTESLPIDLRNRLKQVLSRKAWEKYKIDVDDCILTNAQCTKFEEQYIEKYFRHYDCIISGTIIPRESSVKIDLKYTIGGETKSMATVTANETSDIVTKIMNTITGQLPNIMGK